MNNKLSPNKYRLHPLQLWVLFDCFSNVQPFYQNNNNLNKNKSLFCNLKLIFPKLYHKLPKALKVTRQDAIKFEYTLLHLDIHVRKNKKLLLRIHNENIPSIFILFISLTKVYYICLIQLS